MLRTYRFALITLLLPLLSLSPRLLLANGTFTYTSDAVATRFTMVVPSKNLATGTSVTPVFFSMTYPAPQTDNAGFPLGTGSGYVTYSNPGVAIGTNANGDITSWTLTALQFASYPAFPGENPTDFYCTYNVTFTQGGGSGTLVTDNDAGFCPATSPTATVTSTWVTSIFASGFEASD